MYKYKVKEIIKVYDGDTITVAIDLGFNVIKIETFRLARIDAPEMRQQTLNEAKEARDFLKVNLLNAKEVLIETKKHKKGKYGRYIVEVYADGVNMNDLLIEKGYAKLYGERQS